MSERVCDCCFVPTWAIFQLYNGKEKLQFDEIIMMFALYWNNVVSWIFIMQAHWHGGYKYAAPLAHFILLFCGSQYLLLLLNSAWLAEKQQMPLLLFGLIRPLRRACYPKRKLQQNSLMWDEHGVPTSEEDVMTVL